MLCTEQRYINKIKIVCRIVAVHRIRVRSTDKNILNIIITRVFGTRSVLNSLTIFVKNDTPPLIIPYLVCMWFSTRSHASSNTLVIRRLNVGFVVCNRIISNKWRPWIVNLLNWYFRLFKKPYLHHTNTYDFWSDFFVHMYICSNVKQLLNRLTYVECECKWDRKQQTEKRLSEIFA